MPSDSQQKSSYALSFWFLGIGALGLVQFYGKAYRNDLNAIAWIWLIGSLALLALAAALAWRERRKRG